MENANISTFELLTTIQQILKSYTQNNYEIHGIKKIFEQLQKLKVSPEIIFQQLISNADKLYQLKYALYNQIMKNSVQRSSFSLDTEKEKQINYQKETESKFEDSIDILRKISAIKGQAMFINQQLSVQKLESSLNQKIIHQLNKLSLRKLIKEFLKRNKSQAKYQFLNPLCIRLIVLQESIILYLEKSQTLFYSLLNAKDEKSSQKSFGKNTVSSLSASIELFIENQSKSKIDIPEQSPAQMSQYIQCQPTIKSNFQLNRNFLNKPARTKDRRQARQLCCLWF